MMKKGRDFVVISINDDLKMVFIRVLPCSDFWAVFVFSIGSKQVLRRWGFFSLSITASNRYILFILSAGHPLMSLSWFNSSLSSKKRGEWTSWTSAIRKAGRIIICSIFNDIKLSIYIYCRKYASIRLPGIDLAV